MTDSVLTGYLPQSGSPQGGHGDAVRVGRVGLTGLGGVEQPGSRGQFRRHVEHGLAVGDQALGDVPADAVAALDRPDPLLVLPTGLEHRLVAVAVSAEPALRKTFSRSLMISMVADRLCGSMPMMTRPSQTGGGQVK